MSKLTTARRTREVWPAIPELPPETRGFRRERARRERKLERVSGSTLIVAIDLARERQAITYQRGSELLRRSRVTVRPRDLHLVLQQAEQVREKAGLERLVVAMEPAGHYWRIAAEVLERHNTEYVIVHPLSVKRSREEARYTPDRSDPKDADLIAELAVQGRFTEARLPHDRELGTLDGLAREYLQIRKQAAAEQTRLTNFWDQFLPEHPDVFMETGSATAMAIALALLPLSKLAELSEAQWCTRVREHATSKNIRISWARALLPLLLKAHADPVRRSTDGLVPRIRGAAQRRALLESQKQSLRTEIMDLYATRPEAAYLDSIPGSEPFYNALLLGLVGNFADYDHPRALVKLAGNEVLERTSGEYAGVSRISHRGRSRLRAVGYQQSRFLVKRNPDFGSRFHRMISQGHNDLQAFTAITNSYLRTAHVLVCKQALYSSEKRRKEDRG